MNQIKLLKFKKILLSDNIATVDPKTGIITIDDTQYFNWEMAYNLVCYKTENWIQDSIDNDLLVQMKKEAIK